MAVAVASVVVCALIWGTTWYAITFQLGVVDPIASIVWRFGLASIVLFALAKATGQSIRLSRFQHLCAAAQGILAFGASYALVYEAEMRVASAIVAVAFASMALMNLIMFRVVERQTAARPVWIGAGLGAVGVVVISGGELIGADLGPVGMVGIAMALGASVASTAGNYFAWKGQGRGTNVLPGTAWAMAYGVAGLGLVGLLTGVHWAIDLSPAYHRLAAVPVDLRLSRRLRPLSEPRPLAWLYLGQLHRRPDARDRHGHLAGVRGGAVSVDGAGRSDPGHRGPGLGHPRAQGPLSLSRTSRASFSAGWRTRRLRPSPPHPW